MRAFMDLQGWMAWRALPWAVCLAAVVVSPAEKTVHALASSAPARPAEKASFDVSVVNLQLYPEERTLKGGNASQQYVVMGTLADGSRKDLTAQASFSLSDPEVAREQQRGRFTAVADGETEVLAVVGPLEARSRLQVEDSNWKRPFHFSRDILSILTPPGLQPDGVPFRLEGPGRIQAVDERIPPAAGL